MKFEQAYYTWGENQISRYECGLGICAASNHDMSFLDNCLTVGSDFNAEATTEQSEFLVYSDKFDCFVAVAVNQAPVASDGRRNKLCHFFIPQEKNVNMDPEKYLLEYPFEKEKPLIKNLAVVELEEASYGYKEILEQYISNFDKFKELLYKVYQCLFGEKEILTIVIDQNGYEANIPSIARSLMWVFHALTPSEFRKTLTYGVNTTVNKKGIHFHFTSHADEDAYTYLMNDSSVSDVDSIPEFIHALAELAWKEHDQVEVIEKVKNFLKAVLEQDLSGGLDWSNLQLLYWKWKMDNGFYLSEQELEKRMANLLWMADKKEWHGDFMRKFLVQIHGKELKEASAIAFWNRLIFPWLNRLEERKDVNPMQNLERMDIYTIAKKLLEAMSKGNYFASYIKALPKNARNNLIPRLYDEEDECKKTGIIHEFWAVENSDALKKYLELYPEVTGSEKFRENLYDKGRNLYREADRYERSKISNLLKRKVQWMEELKKEITEIGDVYVFLEHLETELDRIEDELVSVYYRKLLDFAKGEQDNNLHIRVKNAEKQLASDRRSEISIQDYNEFQDTLKEWKRQEEIVEISQNDVFGLLKMDWVFIRKHKIYWTERIKDLLMSYEGFDYNLYKDLKDKYPDVYNAAKDDEALNQYEKSVWSYVKNGHNDAEILKYKMEFQMCIMKYRKDYGYSKSVDLWHQLDRTSSEVFRVLYNYKKESYVYSDFASNEWDYYKSATPKSSGIRSCYLIWEKVIEKKERLTEKEFTQIMSGKSSEWMTMEFLNELCELVTDHPQEYDVQNFCVLVKCKERWFSDSYSTNDREIWLLDQLRRYKNQKEDFIKAIIKANNNSRDEILNKIMAYCMISYPEELNKEKLKDYTEYGAIVEQFFGDIEELHVLKKRGGEIVKELRESIEEKDDRLKKLMREMQDAYKCLESVYSDWKELRNEQLKDQRYYQKIENADKKNLFGINKQWDYTKTNNQEEQFSQAENIYSKANDIKKDIDLDKSSYKKPETNNTENNPQVLCNQKNEPQVVPFVNEKTKPTMSYRMSNGCGKSEYEDNGTEQRKRKRKNTKKY